MTSKQTPKRDGLMSLVSAFAGQAAILTIPRVFLDVTGGDHIGALYISQCVYWSDRTKAADGSFYKSADEWRAELHISYDQLARVRNAYDGFVTHFVKKPAGQAAPRSHYRVNFDALESAIRAALVPQVQEPAADQPAQEPAQIPLIPTLGFPQNGNSPALEVGETPKSDIGVSRKSYTKITPKNTQENTLPAASGGAATAKAAKVKVDPSAMRALVLAIQTAQGYPVSNWGAESRAAYWLLENGYTQAEALACRSYLKTNPFFNETPVTLCIIRARIGEWKAGGAPAKYLDPKSKAAATRAKAAANGATRIDYDRLKLSADETARASGGVYGQDIRVLSDETRAALIAKIGYQGAK